MAHFIARQPIFNRARGVVAYELLFRDGLRNAFPQRMVASEATLHVIHDTLNVIGIQGLVGDARAFINVDRGTLGSGALDALPPRRTTIELLETLKPDAQVVSMCRALQVKGFELAVGDFALAPGFESFLKMADIIKIDFRETRGEARSAVVREHARRGLRFLAEKVETLEEMNAAAAMSYSLFQGYFFAKPEMVPAREIKPSKASRLRLLHLTTESGLSFAAIEQAIREDAAISMRLLRYLSSAGVGMRVKVTSIKHALTLLGERPLRRWIALVTMAALGEGEPTELVQTALVQARFCELLGERRSEPAPEGEMFILGLLSLSDVMLGRPMAEVLESMAVTDRVRTGLLGKGEFAGVLRLTTAHARGDWEQASAEASLLGLRDTDVAEAYEAAVVWARSVGALGP